MKNRVAAMFLVLIISLHLFLLSRLNFFPYPELFIYSYLTEQGLIPYKEIFDQHTPGIMFFPVNLATLGIDTPEEARILHLGAVVLTQILLFFVAKAIFKSNRLSLFANFLYLIWQPFFEGYVLWIDTFVPIFLLLGFYILSSYTKRNLFIGGFILATSFLFKQVAAPLIALVGIYVWYETKSLVKAFSYLAGISVPLLALSFWVSVLGIWNEYVYWTVLFNLTTFSEMGRKFPDLVGLVRTLPLFGPAFVSLVLDVKTKSRIFYLIAIYLIGSLAFIYARFDYIHLQPAIPFAVILCVYLFSKIKGNRILVVLTYAFISLPLLISFYKANVGDKIIFFGDLEKKISQKVRDYTNEGKTVFAFGTMPHLYQMTNTLPPGRVFVFQFPWFMVEAENAIYGGLVKDPPIVVVRDKGATTAGKNLVKNMPKIEAYVNRYYESIDVVDGIEIMRKKLR